MGGWGRGVEVLQGPSRGPGAVQRTLFSPDEPPHESRVPHLTAALRLLEVPEPIEVECTAGVPSAFWWRGCRLPVECASGPERLSGDWWRDGYAREYWRCEGAAGDFLIYLDGGGERRWHLQGWYD
jgi:protein ImuB